MRHIPLLILLSLLSIKTFAQQKKIDSLKALIALDKVDTIRGKHLYALARIYSHSNPAEAIKLAQQCYNISETYKNYHLSSRSLNLLANTFTNVGDYTKAMQLYFRNLKQEEEHNDTHDVIQAYNNIGSAYNSKGDYKKAYEYLVPGLKKLDSYVASHKNPDNTYITLYSYLYENIGTVFFHNGELDTAEKYFRLSNDAATKAHYIEFNYVYYNDIGETESLRGHPKSAKNDLLKAIEKETSVNDIENVLDSYYRLTNVYTKYNQPDSAIYYAQKGLEIARKENFLQYVLDLSKMLSKLYDRQQNISEAYKYTKIANATNDSVFNQEKVRQLVSLDFEERQRQQDILAAQKEYANKVRNYVLFAGVVIMALLVFVFWRNSQHRKKANKLLQQQKEEVQSTLSQLLLTQRQLIQSEKMASLGELTAGIAHEIQNPLNFVNNFSEVSMELIEEMTEELENGDKDEAIAIASDIRQNLEKIRHHGQRADGIVKGMLQHSRASSTTKEPTDINKLADEYMRLSYHGLRAKDKSFNAQLEMHLAENLPVVDVVPQDVGRVLLNMFNNAFYAVQQKSKELGADFKPTVSITTTANGGMLTIKVRDNGTGIPEAIKEKIMQPFFTTKPTGDGTGLGLSLSYDIVVKGHGGKIDVMSKEGEYSEFIITLPL